MLLLLSIVALLPAISSAAQEEPIPVSAQVRYSLHPKKGEISGWCINHSRREKKLTYHLLVRWETHPQRDGKEYREKGHFTIAPYEALQVASYLTTGPAVDSPYALLQIYEDSGPVALAAFPPAAPSVHDQGDAAEDPAGQLTESWIFLVDRTKTIAGQHFFYLFQSKWETLDPGGAFTLTVEEIPLRGRTTRIRLLFNEEEYLSKALQPKPDYLESLADYAIESTLFLLKEEQRLQHNLKKEDLSGNGVY